LRVAWSSPMSAVTLHNAAVGTALTACTSIHAVCSAQQGSCAEGSMAPWMDWWLLLWTSG